MDPIGLTLSGGGFRAMLFHLGVVRYLREVQCEDDSRLLTRVQRICSVSGGSVLAAHLVLNWVGYTGSDREFDEAASKIISLAKRDVRGRIQRRVGLSWILGGLPRLCFSALSPTSLLTSEYIKLYGPIPLSQLNRRDEGQPELHILATSMSTGNLCSFNASGIMTISETGKSHTLDISSLFVASAVAASSAFPPVFAPVRLQPAKFGYRQTESSSDEYFTDGGVYDNTGIVMMDKLQSPPNVPLRMIVVSDAGAEMDNAESRFRSPVDRFGRITDILMTRIAKLEQLRELVGTQAIEPVPIKINNASNPYLDPLNHLIPEVQRKARLVRTDLDAFSDDEIYVLTRHGYHTAESVFAPLIARYKFKLAVRKTGPWSPQNIYPDVANLSKSLVLRHASIDG